MISNTFLPASPSLLSLVTRRANIGQPQCRKLSSYFISPGELSDALSRNPTSPISTSPRVIPLCASWFLPNDPEQRSGPAVFRRQRIPRARFFDLDAIKDARSPLPHMLPSPTQFSDAMTSLGVRKDDEIVVYDSAELGIFSAPRVGWTLQVFGHPKVHLLNNFRLWVDQGFPTESGEPVSPERSHYPVPEVDWSRVIAFDEVKEIAKDYGKEGSEGVQILDARPAGRFSGADPEPRPGLPSGHIPGSISLPLSDLLDPATKAVLPKSRLRAILSEKGVDPSRPIVSTCGTGVTAAVIDAALGEVGFGDSGQRRLYDGSWTEWAQKVTEADGLIRKDV
ncbi:MAG: hypothetical protein M1817_000056 [Caeruleum heppii]|nr:MAG: hypothetical protein M1817_000056 [Caeruleum heppii]